jgi:hypothetical protein
VEDQETLEGRAVVLFHHQFRAPFKIDLAYQNTTDLVQSTIQDLLSNCVVTTSIVVGRILLTADQQLGMEQLAVITRANLVDGRRVEVDEDGARDVFAAARLSEHGIELAGVVESLRVRVGTTILLEAVLEQVPAFTINLQPSCIMCICMCNRRLTAPRRCFRAVYRPGRYGGEESNQGINISGLISRVRRAHTVRSSSPVLESDIYLASGHLEMIFCGLMWEMR